MWAEVVEEAKQLSFKHLPEAIDLEPPCLEEEARLPTDGLLSAAKEQGAVILPNTRDRREGTEGERGLPGRCHQDPVQNAPYQVSSLIRPSEPSAYTRQFPKGNSGNGVIKPVHPCPVDIIIFFVRRRANEV